MLLLLVVLLTTVEGARSDAERHTSPMLCFPGGAQAKQGRTSRTRRRRTEGGWLVGNREWALGSADPAQRLGA